MAWYFLLAVVSSLFFFAMKRAKYYAFPDGGDDGRQEEPAVWLLAMVAPTMLAIRLMLAVSLEGYAGDVQTFQAWAIRAAEDLGGFYSGGFFADYPPGYIYVLYLVGTLKQALLLTDGSSTFLALIKLPAIVADVATAALVYQLASHHSGRGPAVAFSLMYGFNPAVVLDSSIWGQVDSVFTFFVVLAVFFLSRTQLIAAVSTFAVAVLIKPQALIFTPLLLAVAYDLLNSGNGRKALTAASAGLMVFVVGIAPFAATEGPLWILTLYGTTMTSYPYATVNAYNLFALSGGNFSPETATWLLVPFKHWSTFFIGGATCASLLIYRYGPVQARLYLMAAFLIAAVFVFSARMHERYLFPVLIFALLSALYTGNPKLLAVFTGFTITNFLNVAHVLIASTRDIYQIPRFDPLLLIIAAANLFLFCYMVVSLLKPALNPEQQASLSCR